MLSDTVAAVVLPAEDMARARAFYTDKLGLPIAFENDQGVGFGAGAGTIVFVYPHGKTKADHTVAAFAVSDVPAKVQALRAAGVVFLEYDQPGLKTVDGIADSSGGKGAWFKDSEGNILSIVEM